MSELCNGTSACHAIKRDRLALQFLESGGYPVCNVDRCPVRGQGLLIAKILACAKVFLSLGIVRLHTPPPGVPDILDRTILMKSQEKCLRLRFLRLL